MKYCSACGFQMEDEAAFCSKCGRRAADRAPAPAPEVKPSPTGAPDDQPIVPPAPQTAAPAPSEPQYPAYASAPRPTYTPPPTYGTAGRSAGVSASEALREAVTSPLFLVMAVLFTAGTFLRILSSLTINTQDMTVYSGDGFAEGLAGLSNSIYPLFLLALIAASLLMAAGLWILRSSCSDPYNRSTMGLTLMKAAFVTAMVAMIVFIVLSIASASYAIMTTEDFNTVLEDYPFAGEFDSEGMEGAFYAGIVVGMFIGSAFVLVLPVLYFTFLIRAVGAMKLTLLRDEWRRLPAFPGAAGCAIGVITFFTAFGAGDLFSSLASLLSAAFFITSAVFIFKYNAEVKRGIFDAIMRR